MLGDRRAISMFFDYTILSIVKLPLDARQFPARFRDVNCMLCDRKRTILVPSSEQH